MKTDKEIKLEDIFNDEKIKAIGEFILKQKQIKTEEISPEQETLDKIKYVLSMGNEAQAIRHLEYYKEYIINRYKETLK